MKKLVILSCLLATILIAATSSAGTKNHSVMLWQGNQYIRLTDFDHTGTCEPGDGGISCDKYDYTDENFYDDVDEVRANVRTDVPGFTSIEWSIKYVTWQNHTSYFNCDYKPGYNDGTYIYYGCHNYSNFNKFSPYVLMFHVTYQYTSGTKREREFWNI